MALLDLADDHDAAHLDAALHYVTDWSLAVDGGAHKGIFTRKLASRFQNVWAFEPITDNWRAIERLPNVERYRMALGDERKRVLMAPGHENTGQGHIAREGEPALMVPLDGFYIEGCGFIKLDVEGYELFALQGAYQTLRRFKPVVMIEENGLCERYGVHPGDSQRFLEGLGYDLVRSIGRDLIFEHRSRKAG